MSGSLREWRKDDRRLRMIHAALELFDEYGFSEVGVADIVERIGVSYRTIHRCFPSKEDVLLGLVVEGNHAFLDRVESVRARALLHSVDVQDRLAAPVERQLAYEPERDSEVHLAVGVVRAVSAEAQRRWRSIPSAGRSLAGEFRAVMAGLPAVIPGPPGTVD